MMNHGPIRSTSLICSTYADDFAAQAAISNCSCLFWRVPGVYISAVDGYVYGTHVLLSSGPLGSDPGTCLIKAVEACRLYRS